jgi:hypothetical protein
MYDLVERKRRRRAVLAERVAIFLLLNGGAWCVTRMHKAFGGDPRDGIVIALVMLVTWGIARDLTLGGRE